MHDFRPIDDHDRRLLGHVRPDGWRNPEPSPRYDLVVIGGGTAGLVCAAGAAGLGARVALIERSLLGGDCLNTGCVPSKSLLRSARAVHEARAAMAVGVGSTTEVAFDAVMSRVRARRADIAPHDSAARLSSLGVHVFLGEAAFERPDAVRVDGRTLRFRRAVIASGARPSIPPVAGLGDVPYHTNETIFSLTGQPRELVVIGAGAVGCELAQAFALLGTRVTLVEPAPRILPREDADAAAILADRLENDGVDVRVGTAIRRVSHDGRFSLATDKADVTGDTLLVATGRTPNIEGLNLDAAGVRTSSEGLVVDDRLQTSNTRVYAAGDVCSPFKFTHAADAMARIVIQNALFYGRRRLSSLAIPWCTYTFPEVAQVGVTETREAGGATITVPLADVDRSRVDDETGGFVRVHHVGGRVVGATIVAPHAGELIGYVASLMRRGGRVDELSSEIFPYPTVAEALRRAGDSYRRTKLTPGVRRAFDRYFRILRSM